MTPTICHTEQRILALLRVEPDVGVDVIAHRIAVDVRVALAAIAHLHDVGLIAALHLEPQEARS
jgi:hypothetical protein